MELWRPPLGRCGGVGPGSQRYPLVALTEGAKAGTSCEVVLGGGRSWMHPHGANRWRAFQDV